MNNDIVLSVIIILAVIGIVLFTMILLPIDTSFLGSKKVNTYQGPVRPGDDEQYFRQTGITKPLNTPEVNK